MLGLGCKESDFVSSWIELLAILLTPLQNLISKISLFLAFSRKFRVFVIYFFFFQIDICRQIQNDWKRRRKIFRPQFELWHYFNFDLIIFEKMQVTLKSPKHSVSARSPKNVIWSRSPRIFYVMIYSVLHLKVWNAEIRYISLQCLK